MIKKFTINYEYAYQDKRLLLSDAKIKISSIIINLKKMVLGKKYSNKLGLNHNTYV